MTHKYIFKFIIIGDMSVGKSCLMQRFTEQHFRKDLPHTIGVEFGTTVVDLNGVLVKLQIWDTAGQERFQSLGSAFYRGADACILVFDVTQSDTFSHVGSWLEEFSIQAGRRDCVLLGNKTDLEDRRQVATKHVQAWCAKQNVSHNAGPNEGEMKYYETSAKENVGVEEAFLAVATAALAKKAAVEEVVALPQTVNLSQPNAAAPAPAASSCAC